jgi:hypothetical protein
VNKYILQEKANTATVNLPPHHPPPPSLILFDFEFTT